MTLGPGDLQQVGKCLVTNLSKIVADHHAQGSSVFCLCFVNSRDTPLTPFLFDIKWGMQQIKPVLCSREVGIAHACFVEAKSQNKTF